MPEAIKLGVELEMSPAQRQLNSFVTNAQNQINSLKISSNITRPLGTISSQADDFTRSLGAANARVIAFGASAGLVLGVERAFSELVKTSINVEKSLTAINVIFNATSQNLAKFGNSLFDIAKETGKSFDEVAKVATEASRQGLGFVETQKRTRDALILSRQSGLDAADSLEILTAGVNSYTKSALDSTTIINKLANVDANFAVSSGQLGEALKRSASVANDAGVSFDQLIALTTSLQQTTARGGAVIGNAIKSIFTRIEKPEVLAQIEELGVAVRDLSGEALNPIEVLTNLSKVFDNLTKSQQNQVASLASGLFQVNQFRAALADLSNQNSIYKNALDTSNKTTDEAIVRNKELNTTVAALVQKTLTSFTQLASTIGKTSVNPATKGILGNVNELLQAITPAGEGGTSIGDKLGQGIIQGLTNVLTGPGLLVISKILGTLIVNFLSFVKEAATGVLGLNNGLKQQAVLQSEVNLLIEKIPGIQDAVRQGLITETQLREIVLNQIKATTIALEAQEKLSQAVATNILKSGAVNVKLNDKGGTIRANVEPGFAPNFSKSFKVPNFSADPINDAIEREQKSGVPPHLIRVGKDSALVSPINPLGLGIYNLRDEPAGLQQGINRNRQQGKDPKLAGIEQKNIVPNFIKSLPNFTITQPISKKVPNFAANDSFSSDDSTRLGSGFLEKYLVPEIEKLRTILRTQGEEFVSIENSVEGLKESFSLTSQAASRVKQKLDAAASQYEGNLKTASEAAFQKVNNQFPATVPIANFPQTQNIAGFLNQAPTPKGLLNQGANITNLPQFTQSTLQDRPIRVAFEKTQNLLTQGDIVKLLTEGNKLFNLPQFSQSTVEGLRSTRNFVDPNKVFIPQGSIQPRPTTLADLEDPFPHSNSYKNFVSPQSFEATFDSKYKELKLKYGMEPGFGSPTAPLSSFNNQAFPKLNPSGNIPFVKFTDSDIQNLKEGAFRETNAGFITNIPQKGFGAPTPSLSTLNQVNPLETVESLKSNLDNIYGRLNKNAQIQLDAQKAQTSTFETLFNKIVSNPFNFSARRDLEALNPKAKDQAVQQGVAGLQSKAFIASIALPILGETLNQFIPTDSSTGRGVRSAISGTTSAASLAATGFAVGGKFGPQIGTALGIGSLALTLPKIIDDFTNNLPELQKRFESLREVSTRTSEALNSFIQIQEQLADVEQGRAQISRGSLANLKDKQNQDLLSLSAGQQTRIQSALQSGGLPALIDTRAQIDKEQQGQLRLSQLELTLGNLRNRVGFFKEGITEKDFSNPVGTETRVVKPGISATQTVFGDKLKKDIANSLDNFSSSFFTTQGLSNNEGKSQSIADVLLKNTDFSKALLGQFTQSKNNPPAFFNALESAGNQANIPPQEIQTIIAEFGKFGAALPLVIDKVLESISPEKLNNLSRINELVGAERIRTQKELATFADAIFKTQIGLINFNKSLEGAAKITLQNLSAGKERQTTLNTGFINQQENFVGPETIQRLKNSSAIQGIETDRQIGIRTAGLTLQTGISQTISSEILSFLSSELQKSIQTKSIKLPEETRQTALNFASSLTNPTALQNTLTTTNPEDARAGIEAILKNLESQRLDIVNKQIQGGLPQEQQTKLEVLNSTIVKLQNEFQDFLNTTNLLNVTAKNQISIKELENRAALELINTQKKLSIGGGLQNILSPNNNVFENLANASSVRQLGISQGNQALETSGSLDLANIFQSLGADVSKIAPDLKESIVSGLDNQIQKVLSVSGLSLRGETTRGLAETQFANAFKTESTQTQLLTQIGTLVTNLTNPDTSITAVLQKFTDPKGLNVTVTNINELKEAGKVPDLTQILAPKTRIPAPFDIETNSLQTSIPSRSNIKDLINNDISIGAIRQKQKQRSNLFSDATFNAIQSEPPDKSSFFNNTGNLNPKISESLIEKLKQINDLSIKSNVNIEKQITARKDTLLDKFSTKELPPLTSDVEALSSNPAGNITTRLPDITVLGKRPEEEIKPTINTDSLTKGSLNQFGVDRKGEVSNFGAIFEAAIKKNNELKTSLEQTKNLITQIGIEGTHFVEEINAAKKSADDLNIRLGNFKDVKFADSFFRGFDFSQKDFIKQFNDGLISSSADFKDAFSGVLKDLAKGATSIGDSLKSAAIGFGEKILGKVADLGTNALLGGVSNLFSGLLGHNQGGVVKGFSVGGIVTGGSGTKDDVPALLEDGEYVINKNAVNRIGLPALEQLTGERPSNTSSFSTLGPNNANINLANQLNYSSTRPETLAGGVYSVDKNLSSIALEDENNPQNRIRTQKEQNLVSYIQGFQAYNDQKAQALKAFDQQKTNRLIGAYISAAFNIAGAGLKAGTGSTGTGFTASSSGGAGSLDLYNYGNLASSGGLMTTAGIVKHYAGGGNVFGGNSPKDTVKAMLTGGEFVVKKDIVSKYGIPFFDKLNRGDTSKLISSTINNTKRLNDGGDIKHYNIGGSVSNNDGNRYETGGTVKQYNIGGAISRFESGGEIKHYNYGGTVRNYNTGGDIKYEYGGSVNQSDNNVSDALQELITVNQSIRDSLSNQGKNTQTTAQSAPITNNVTINVNIDDKGKASADVKTSSTGQDKQPSAKDNADSSKKLGEIIKQKTLETIIEQQRPNGLLANTRTT